MTQVIVLNGGSSSGKTGIARCLQAILPQPWLRLGVDDLVDALPPSVLDSESGIAFGKQGEVSVGGDFSAAQIAWLAGVAAMVHEGVSYDLEVDTTHTESLACARLIASHVRLRGAVSTFFLRDAFGIPSGHGS